MKLKVTMEEKTTLYRPLNAVLMYSEGRAEMSALTYDRTRNREI